MDYGDPVPGCHVPLPGLFVVMALPLAQGGERSLVEDGERSLGVNPGVRHRRWHVTVGVCRTGELQRGTEDQDRNGESVPDGECERVHGSH